MSRFIFKRIFDKNLIILCVGYFLIVIFVMLTGSWSDINPFFSIYEGVVFFQVRVIKFVVTLILFSTPVYMFGFHVQTVFRDGTMFVQVRGKSRLSYIVLIYGCAVIIAFIAVILVIFAGIIYTCMIKSLSFLKVLTYIMEARTFLGLHFLEILLFENLMIVLLCYRVNSIFIFYAYVLMYMLYFFPYVEFMKYWPVGMATLTRIGNIFANNDNMKIGEYIGLCEMLLLNGIVYIIGLFKNGRKR